MNTMTKTWWGERLLSALEEFTDSGRLARGRAYASDHRVKQWYIKKGVIQAKIRGNKNPHQSTQWAIDRAILHHQACVILLCFSAPPSENPSGKKATFRPWVETIILPGCIIHAIFDAHLIHIKLYLYEVLEWSPSNL